MLDSGPTQLQSVLDRMHAGDAAAHDEWIGRSYEGLRRLTAKMLRAYPVGGWVKSWQTSIFEVCEQRSPPHER